MYEEDTTDGNEFDPVKKEEQKSPIEIPKGAQKLELKRSVRCCIYITFFFLNMCISLDDGVIASCAEQVKYRMQIDDTKLGLLESASFVGIIVGSSLGIPILNAVNRKWLLIVASLFISLGVLVYIFVTNLWAIIALRIVLGFARSFSAVYLPLWIDQFGIESKKTLMLAFVNLGPTLGSCLGLGIAQVFVKIKFEDEYWQKASYSLTMLIMTVVLIVISVVMMFFSNDYFIKNAKKIGSDALVLAHFRPSFLGQRASIVNEEGTGFRPSFKASIFYGEGEAKDELEEDIKKIEKDQMGTGKKIKLVMHNSIFTLCSFSVAFYSFSLGAFSYWGPNYISSALSATEPQKILLSIILITIPVPIISSMISGVITDLMGGYAGKRISIIVAIDGIISSALGLTISIPSGLAGFNVLFAFLMFAITFILPPLTGIIISSIVNDLKGFGTGIFQFIYNLIGYMPAPLTFGALKNTMIKIEQGDLPDDQMWVVIDGMKVPTEKGLPKVQKGTKMAMLISMSLTAIGAILLIIAAIIRYKKADYYDELMKNGVEPGQNEDEDEHANIQLIEKQPSDG